MNESHLDKSCGCCEGVEQLTPHSIANRPGLDTLSYRVGTHSTFLETMLARLSSLALELPAEGQRDEEQKIYPLQGLTARQASDPAIALLDSWATVADVLTFYQERIANEGYLRTATERRSILELARLVGYKLRPGVAANVYLAFTLDNGYRVTIPAGTRAQSVPGPGELPQSFETSEPLPARDVWNQLKPRLTRPQTITGVETQLYLEGIANNLKPNDPLLFVASAAKPDLVRIESIETQVAENRTRVILQAPTAAQSVGNGTQDLTAGYPNLDAFGISVAALKEEIQNVTARYLYLAEFGVSSGKTAGNVTAILQQLQVNSGKAATIAELETATDSALAALQPHYQEVVEKQYVKLEPWVGGVIQELRGTKQAATVDNEGITKEGITKAPLMMAVNENGGPAVTQLSGYLEAVAKSPSVPPANNLQLSRSITQTYGATSDTATKLLTTLRPELRSKLYQAWRNLPVTAPIPLQLYALRVRASVFGHNGPPEPIIRESDGVITGHKEWSLQEPTSTRDENFMIQVRISYEDEAERWFLTATITAGHESAESNAFELEEEGEGNFQISLSNDTVSIQVSSLTIEEDNLSFLELDITFSNRPIEVTMTIESDEASPEAFHLTITGNAHLVSTTGRLAALDSFNDMTITVGGQSTITEALEEANVVWLDTTYEQIVPGSWVVVERPYPYIEYIYIGGNDIPKIIIPKTIIAQVTEVSEQSRSDYGLPGIKSTRLTLDQNWLDPKNDSFAIIRGTTVYAQSEPLTLTEAPIDPVVEAVCGSDVELDGLYDGLEAGRWLIIAGERTDVTPEEAEPASAAPAIGETGNTTVPEEETAEPLTGISTTELVMLAGVEQVYDADLPGETTHTRLLLANDLAYCYKRDTVTIYGNVAKATHGETRHEVLGSGDGSQAFQRFTLKQPPLTFVSAPTPSGIESTLVVRVNDIKWHEANNLAELEPADRAFTTQTDDEEKTTVIFGDGRYGARLPTGVENVKAVYRNGIGKMGNVAAGQISLLATRPLGLKEVINPLPASGGADRDSRDQARDNAPLAMMALDRLVSVQDYADFTRTFAGIGKASAVRLTDGRRQVVHLTIAGAGDIPIVKKTDLYRHLGQALRRFGDPYQPIQIDVYRRKLLIISAKVRLRPDYLWEAVAPKLRAALLDTFSFDHRQLGQDVLLSEVISAVQAIDGVAYVDVDILDAVTANASLEELTNLAENLALRPRIVAEMAHLNPAATDPDEHIQAAQLVYLSPDVPDTLILTEVPNEPV